MIIIEPVKISVVSGNDKAAAHEWPEIKRWVVHWILFKYSLNYIKFLSNVLQMILSVFLNSIEILFNFISNTLKRISNAVQKYFLHVYLNF